MDFEKALNHLKESIHNYVDLIGKPGVMVWFALPEILKLAKRYDSGERTESLYNEMMGVE